MCKIHHISVRKLEQMVGVADKTVAHLDTNKPSLEKVVKFADYFGVSVDYLIGREEFTTIDEETALIAKFRLLTASQKETILSNIDFLLSQSPIKKRDGNVIEVRFK